MGFITVLWGDRWIIMAAVAFWVGHHRPHTTERYAKAQSHMRDPTSGPSFSDRVTHVREVASQQVMGDKGHSWQETARAARALPATPTVLCGPQPMHKQWGGWTGSCGSYFKMPFSGEHQETLKERFMTTEPG